MVVSIGSVAPAAASIPLPTPVHDIDPLRNATQFGLRPDRLLTSVVPGPVNNKEAVTAYLGSDGAPSNVTDRQTMVITKPGSYIVRELGPARAVTAVGSTVPPVLELGQVVWQGFSPGTRRLSAVLALDPAIEAQRLPMSVTLAFRDAQGDRRPLLPGGVAPSSGTAEVTLVNQTQTSQVVATGTSTPRAIAAALQRLYDAARHPHAALPPYAGSGLRRQLPGHKSGLTRIDVTAPLHVHGTIRVAGAQGNPVTGPTASAVVGGARLAGSLDGSAVFDVAMRAGQRLRVDLDVTPWLDPRLLVPPAGGWARWAASHPSVAALRTATANTVTRAAEAARAAEYSPYLQADTPGSDLSTFHYVIEQPPAATRSTAALHAKPGAIAAAVIALLAIIANGALLWRRL